MALLSNLSNYKNLGLLTIRIGLGVMFIMHGYPKLMGGPGGWKHLGGAMHIIGIHFLPVVWGLLSALAETLGGLLVLLGLAFRPACLFLVFNLAMATVSHFSKGDDILTASHAIELAFVFAGLLFVGPGKYSVDKK
ncbi:MAG: DoxX family protein [Sphingobacteriaceae bacterium]|nr:MAG: DoxX family protein [Sphingobacteriaceae bacterium]